MRSQSYFVKTAIETALRKPQNAAMDIDEIRRGLEKPGKTQRGLARKLGVDDSAISRLLKGDRQIKNKEVPLIRDYLELVEIPNAKLPTQGSREPPTPNEFMSYPRDVPIMGVTVGGSEGEFLINAGEPADYARRPPPIARANKVFALYVQGNSMSRWREAGSLVYLDPVRPPRPGDRVVVELQPEKDGDGHPAYLKEMVTRTATKLRLKQYNPEATIEIALSKVLAVHRVIEWEELVGL